MFVKNEKALVAKFDAGEKAIIIVCLCLHQPHTDRHQLLSLSEEMRACMVFNHHSRGQVSSRGKNIGRFG